MAIDPYGACHHCGVVITNASQHGLHIIRCHPECGSADWIQAYMYCPLESDPNKRIFVGFPPTREASALN